MGDPTTRRRGIYGNEPGTDPGSSFALFLMKSTPGSCLAAVPIDTDPSRKKTPRSEKVTPSPRSKRLVWEVAGVISKFHPQGTPSFDFHPLDHPLSHYLALLRGSIRSINPPLKLGTRSPAFGGDIPPSHLGHPPPRDHRQ